MHQTQQNINILKIISIWSITAEVQKSVTISLTCIDELNAANRTQFVQK